MQINTYKNNEREYFSSNKNPIYVRKFLTIYILFGVFLSHALCACTLMNFKSILF